MNGLLLIIISVLFINTSCYKEVEVEKADEDTIVPGTGLDDWTSETHSDDIYPNYNVVYPQDKVNRIDIVFTSEDWDAMLQDLSDNIGEFGAGGENPAPPIFANFNDDFVPPGPGGGGAGETDFTPIFSASSVFFNNIEWYNVGVRFKGNSSLRSTWQSGCMKLAFRFDFDEFEDDYPEIKNQRFYGFQKMAFSNNYDDQSFMHEKVAADIFRDAGLKAPQTAYYQIFVDYGDGPIYFGLYTATEIVEDAMLKEQFGSNAGNCYKPENEAATFAYGTFNTSDFDLKTNEDIADYSDVESLYNSLHSSLRTTDLEQWKTELEAILDVDNFLKWLATNTVIQNWDTYGVMSHNYYLYTNPYTSKIVWIPWDNNEALYGGKREPLSFSMNEVTSSWPLIRYLIDIPEYETLYENYLESVINDAFESSKIKETYSYYHNLISDYVVGSEAEQPGYSFLRSSSDFTNSLSELNNHVDERHDAVINYLSKK
ncbi:MAG: CotH kinase family protein [Bacteroidales bacterium]|nr:CotH kinase family protein [Bacteroidales bacterium]